MLKKVWKWLFYIFISGFCDELKFERAAFILNRIFCNVINVFTVTFDQFNASLINKSIDFFYFFPQKIQ